MTREIKPMVGDVWETRAGEYQLVYQQKCEGWLGVQERKSGACVSEWFGREELIRLISRNGQKVPGPGECITRKDWRKIFENVKEFDAAFDKVFPSVPLDDWSVLKMDDNGDLPPVPKPEITTEQKERFAELCRKIIGKKGECRGVLCHECPMADSRVCKNDFGDFDAKANFCKDWLRENGYDVPGDEKPKLVRRKIIERTTDGMPVVKDSAGLIGHVTFERIHAYVYELPDSREICASQPMMLWASKVGWVSVDAQAHHIAHGDVVRLLPVAVIVEEG